MAVGAVGHPAAPAVIEGDRLPTLTAGRVLLRWLEEDDVDDLYRIFGDPEVMRYWSSPPLADRAAAAALLAEIRVEGHRTEDGIERTVYVPRERRFETPILMQHGTWHGAWC